MNFGVYCNPTMRCGRAQRVSTAASPGIALDVLVGSTELGLTLGQRSRSKKWRGLGLSKSGKWKVQEFGAPALQRR